MANPMGKQRSVYTNIYTSQKLFFESGATRPYAFRKVQLLRLKKAVQAYEDQIIQAL